MKKLLYLTIVLGICTIASCKKEPIVVTDTTVVHKTSFISGSDIFQEYAKKPETYQTVDRKFVSNSGVRYFFTGPFINLSTGEWLESEVDVELTEYWTAKEMMLASLPTESSGMLLSSEGAFAIRTKINGELVRPIQFRVRIPDNSDRDGMDLFFSDPEAETTWSLTYNATVQSLNSIYWTPLLGFPDSLTAGYLVFIAPYDSWYDESGYLTINCDEFVDQGLPLTDVTIRPSADVEFSPSLVTVSLLFPVQNSILSGSWNSDNSGYMVQNVPIGMYVTALAVGVGSNSELLAGMLSFVVEENGIYSFNLENISEEELEDLLAGL